MLLNRGYAISAGIFAVLCWASLPVIIKLGLENIPISYFLFLRFTVSSIFSLLVTPFNFAKISAVPLRRWIFLSALLAANFVLQAIAIRDLPATWYIAVFSLSPLLSLLFLRRQLNAVSACGMALALAGTLVFTLFAGAIENLPWTGMCALAGGMVTWSLYAPSVRAFQHVFSDQQIMAMTSVLSLIPVSVIWGVQGAPMSLVSTAGLLSIGVVGLLVPLAYWAFLFSVREVPVFGISSQYLEPVFGVAFATSILGETLTLAQMVGGLVILAGVATIGSAAHLSES